MQHKKNPFRYWYPEMIWTAGFQSPLYYKTLQMGHSSIQRTPGYKAGVKGSRETAKIRPDLLDNVLSSWYCTSLNTTALVCYWKLGSHPIISSVSPKEKYIIPTYYQEWPHLQSISRRDRIISRNPCHNFDNESVTATRVKTACK